VRVQFGCDGFCRRTSPLIRLPVFDMIAWAVFRIVAQKANDLNDINPEK